MKRNRSLTILALTTTLLAGTYAALQAGPELLPAPPMTPVRPTDTPVSQPTPTESPAYEGCAYMWAYQDLPDLSARLDEAVKQAYPQASAHATAFGEDCVFADGRTQFGAMETDFHVTLPVEDLADREDLGNRIAAVMTIILDGFPKTDLQGPNDGYVEFRFVRGENENLILRVPIQKYREAGLGTSGAELFDLFQPTP